MNDTSLPRSATIRIAVCDDVPEDLERLGSMVEELTADREVRVHRHASAQSLLDAGPYDLIFLDIVMEGIDGMEAARALRKRSERCLIVFVSGSREYLVAGYEVEAFRYLLKPFDKEELVRILEQALSRLEDSGLTVRDRDTLRRVPQTQICYIEAQRRISVIHLIDGTELSVHEGISQLEKRLSGDLFVRCQKSFIVNLNQVRALRRYEIELGSGSRIPVGRKLWPIVKERLVHHLSIA